MLSSSLVDECSVTIEVLRGDFLRDDITDEVAVSFSLGKNAALNPNDPVTRLHTRIEIRKVLRNLLVIMNKITTKQKLKYLFAHFVATLPMRAEILPFLAILACLAPKSFISYIGQQLCGR